MHDRRIHQAYLGLRAVFGAIPVVAGLDKFLDVLTEWDQYLSPIAARMLPMSDTAFMQIVGIIEI